MPWFWDASLIMPVCRYSEWQLLRGSDPTSHELNREAPRGARIGIYIFGSLRPFSIGLVPEYLVAYRKIGSSMSADVESMAASYAVVMQRAQPAESRFAGSHLSFLSREFLRVPRKRSRTLGSSLLEFSLPDKGSLCGPV